MKKLLTLFCFLFIQVNYGQEMQAGFTFLETGNYKNAVTFFENIIKEYPNNKTANLCYGRAVGLNGNAKKAVVVFTELLKTYPTDFEIQLNFAESLLWNKEYNKAKGYYKKLINTNNKSFPALLGYANTLSNLKEYSKALEYVNKALALKPNNTNAMVSKKYMYLGLANQHLQNQEYQKSIAILKKNLDLFPNDKDVQLNLANTYMVSKNYKKANETYAQLEKNTSQYFVANNGRSLIAHLQENDKKSLKIAEQTKSKITATTPEKDIQNTEERYTQALIWNRKFKTAKRHIHQLSKNHKNENWILGLQATLATYTGDFKNSLKAYNHILKNTPTSFDGNLGKASALRAANKTKQAYTSAKETLKHFPNQKDALALLKQLDNHYLPVAYSRYSYSFDNGESKNNIYTISTTIPFSLKLGIKATYETIKSSNDLTNNNTKSNFFGLGFDYVLHSKITMSTTIGTQNVIGNRNEYNRFTTDLLFKTKPFKRQTLDLGYKRQLQSYNAELINREIVLNNFYSNYNVNTTFNVGWFTQYFYTTQSDRNQRNLIFTSLYYTILRKPILKTGVNFQYFTFKNQVPTIYFSPKNFKAVEVFINLNKDIGTVKSKELFYGLTTALGYQYIEKGSKQSTYRVQTNFGYKFNNYANIQIYGTRNNIASVVNNGQFTYTEFGAKFIWTFLQKPIFKTH